MFLLTTSTAANELSPEVEEGVESIKQKKFDFSIESRVFSNDAAPEFMLKYKNLSLDWLHSNNHKNFLKLKVDKEIFSLMGTGLQWNVALNAVDTKKNSLAVLPSVGLNFYMRIRPRLDIYLQFSGFTLGRRAHTTDFESGFKYFPQKNLSISAGWREINFKLRRGGNLNDFHRHGLFAGIRYDF